VKMTCVMVHVLPKTRGSVLPPTIQSNASMCRLFFFLKINCRIIVFDGKLQL
jgi:hypothetical protein